MRARFIGDPVERLSGRFTKPPSDEWFDVPEGMEEKYRNNGHYEVRESAPKRRARKQAEPVKDAWEDDEGVTDAATE